MRVFVSGKNYAPGNQMTTNDPELRLRLTSTQAGSDEPRSFSPIHRHNPSLTAFPVEQDKRHDRDD